MKRYLAYISFFIFLFFLFGLKDIWILLSEKWPHLYAVVNVPKTTWEEIYTYLPYANHFNIDNLLPAAPMAYPGFSKFTYFPPFTLIANGIILKWLCFSNIDLYLLFMHTVFPILSFWFIYLIFKRYVAESWALLFAFFGITFFPNVSLFPYFLNLLFNPTGFIETASLSPMELTRTPVPSFTFFFFIFSFYISTKDLRPSHNRYLLISLLWALNLYVYLFNFIAGIIFWLFYIIYTHYIRDKRLDSGKITKALTKNMLVILVVISPIVIKRLFFFSPLDVEIFQHMGLVSHAAGFIVNKWGLIISYLLPLVAAIIVIRIYCADYYELIYKFTPVFIMIFVDIFISNLHMILGRFFQPELFSIRIGNFFTRYLYYIPIIYFMSSPYKNLFHKDYMNRLSELFHSLFNSFIIKQRVLIVTLGIVLISFFSIFSSMKYVRHYEREVVPRMAEVDRNLDELISVIKGNEGVVVSEDIPVNLLIPVLTKKETLLVNAFSNYISSEEILNRLILFAHILNWDRKQLLDFMMPSDEYKKIDTDNNFIFSNNILNKGFGYWLLNHRKLMDTKELQEYRKMILIAFENFDFEMNIKKYKIKAIHASGKVNPLLPIKSTYRTSKNILYIL